MARPTGDFNAERYFRGDHGLRFYNIGIGSMRAFARSVHLANRESCRSTTRWRSPTN
jgi:hypothetical protein